MTVPLRAGVSYARQTGVEHDVINPNSFEFVFVATDDHSRASFARIHENEDGETACRFLLEAVAWFARIGVKIIRVLTDNGSPFRSAAFRALCVRLGIKHKFTRPYTPRTNGKAERFIQTLLREWAYGRPFTSSYRRRAALPAWLRRYNERRPHAGIGGAAPITRLRSAA